MIEKNGLETYLKLNLKMNNYQIILDENILLDFIKWLPELQDNECYYCCLFARSKYAKNEDGNNKFPHIKTDKAQLKRFTISKKEDLFLKLKQCEVEIGAYQTKDGDDIPQESLAVYIHPNPRNQKKAIFSLMRKLLDIQETNGNNFNLHQEAMSAIQKSWSKKYYLTFDIDTKSQEDLQRVLNCVNREAITLLETRGGYHLLVDSSKVSEQHKKTFYQDINYFAFVDTQAGTDLMIPIPGCTQGEFIPHFIN